MTPGSWRHLAAVPAIASVGCVQYARIGDDTEDGPAHACEVVTAAGGAVQAEGVTVLVPLGALAEDTEICVEETEGEPPEGAIARSPFWRFEPDGIAFAVPVQVTLAFGGEAAYPAMFWDHGEGWAFGGGVVTGTLLTDEVSSFSTAFVGEIERITQVETVDSPDVDILFVIDTSGSMYEEQEMLAESFETLFAAVSTVNYHIGAVSTNMDDAAKSGKLQADPLTGVRIITPETEDGPAVFQRLVLMGVDSHYQEQGRAAAYTALEVLRTTDNDGFYRDSASLAIVVLSDEDDHSDAVPVTQANWIAYLQGLKPYGMLTFSSIVGEDAGNGSTCATAAEIGRMYLQVTDAIGGVAASICTEIASGMEEIAAIVTAPSRMFVLEYVPADGSVAVTAEEPGGEAFALESGEWSWDASTNAVVLGSYHPPDGTLLAIAYTPTEPWAP